MCIKNIIMSLEERVEFIALAAGHSCTPKGPDGEPCTEDGYKCAKCQARQVIQIIKDAGYVKRKTKEEIKLALSLIPLSKDPAQDFYDWHGG